MPIAHKATATAGSLEATGTHLPLRAVLYLREQPHLGKTPDMNTTQGCEMSVGASSIIATVGSVLSQEEKKRGTVDLRLPKAPTKGKFPCYYALLIIEGVGMWLADHSCLQDIVLISPIFRDGQEDQRPDENQIQ